VRALAPEEVAGLHRAIAAFAGVGCKPIPAGVSALATLLQSIAKQELSREPCRSVFPPQR